MLELNLNNEGPLRRIYAL